MLAHDLPDQQRGRHASRVPAPFAFIMGNDLALFLGLGPAVRSGISPACAASPSPPPNGQPWSPPPANPPLSAAPDLLAALGVDTSTAYRLSGTAENGF